MTLEPGRRVMALVTVYRHDNNHESDQYRQGVVQATNGPDAFIIFDVGFHHWTYGNGAPSADWITWAWLPKKDCVVVD